MIYTVALYENERLYLIKTDDVNAYVDRADAIVEPNLKAIHGQKMHELKILGGKIVRKTDAEIARPLAPIQFKFLGKPHKKRVIVPAVQMFFILVVGLVVGYFISKIKGSV